MTATEATQPHDDAPSPPRSSSRRRSSRPIARVALLLAALTCLVGSIAVLLVVRSDDPAVTDRMFTYFDGSQGSFADYRGRPLVVNFWASTCAPCIKEMPAFERVHQDLGDEVAFLGLDVQERVDEGMTMVDQTGVTYDLASDFEGFLLAETSPIAVLPTTLFIDESGHLVATHSGALDEAELRSKLDEYLGA